MRKKMKEKNQKRKISLVNDSLLEILFTFNLHISPSSSQSVRTIWLNYSHFMDDHRPPQGKFVRGCERRGSETGLDGGARDEGAGRKSGAEKGHL